MPAPRRRPRHRRWAISPPSSPWSRPSRTRCPRWSRRWCRRTRRRRWSHRSSRRRTSGCWSTPGVLRHLLLQLFLSGRVVGVDRLEAVEAGDQGVEVVGDLFGRVERADRFDDLFVARLVLLGELLVVVPEVLAEAVDRGIAAGRVVAVAAAGAAVVIVVTAAPGHEDRARNQQADQGPSHGYSLPCAALEWMSRATRWQQRAAAHVMGPRARRRSPTDDLHARVEHTGRETLTRAYLPSTAATNRTARAGPTPAHQGTATIPTMPTSLPSRVAQVVAVAVPDGRPAVVGLVGVGGSDAPAILDAVAGRLGERGLGSPAPPGGGSSATTRWAPWPAWSTSPPTPTTRPPSARSVTCCSTAWRAARQRCWSRTPSGSTRPRCGCWSAWSSGRPTGGSPSPSPTGRRPATPALAALDAAVARRQSLVVSRARRGRRRRAGRPRHRPGRRPAGGRGPGGASRRRPLARRAPGPGLGGHIDLGRPLRPAATPTAGRSGRPVGPVDSTSNGGEAAAAEVPPPPASVVEDLRAEVDQLPPPARTALGRPERRRRPRRRAACARSPAWATTSSARPWPSCGRPGCWPRGRTSSPSWPPPSPP